MYSAREKFMGKFKEAFQDAKVQLQQLKYNSPWTKRSEGVVQANKRFARHIMKKLDCPAKL